MQGLDDCLERLGDPTEPTHKHPITGSLIGNQLWAHRAAIVQIEGQEYDELISANPDNKLRYIDDDNELVIVSKAKLPANLTILWLLLLICLAHTYASCLGWFVFGAFSKASREWSWRQGWRISFQDLSTRA